MKIRFNLKQVSEKNKLTQIMLVTTINKRRIRVYTKLRVEPQYWNQRRLEHTGEASVEIY